MQVRENYISAAISLQTTYSTRSELTVMYCYMERVLLLQDDMAAFGRFAIERIEVSIFEMEQSQSTT
jgi:hypothetical protein